MSWSWVGFACAMLSLLGVANETKVANGLERYSPAYALC